MSLKERITLRIEPPCEPEEEERLCAESLPVSLERRKYLKDSLSESLEEEKGCLKGSSWAM